MSSYFPDSVGNESRENGTVGPQWSYIIPCLPFITLYWIMAGAQKYVDEEFDSWLLRWLRKMSKEALQLQNSRVKEDSYDVEQIEEAGKDGGQGNSIAERYDGIERTGLVFSFYDVRKDGSS